ncbi:MAG: CDP-alcohol phosphatidyltransferase family protein [Evtepia gabavorous]
MARHYNQVTDFGKFMDPLADKLLVMSAMVCVCEVGWMPRLGMLCCDCPGLAVTGLRLVAVEQGLDTLPPSKSGR